MLFGPTPPPRQDPAAEAADGSAGAASLPRSGPLLVRREGRWWYPHELPTLPPPDAGAADVQLRP